MELTFLLADAAQADERGKVSALGIGWTNLPTPTPPIALFAFADLEQDELPAELVFRFALRDASGGTVIVPGEGPFNIEVKSQAKAGGDHSKTGEPVRVPVSLQISAGIPLEPGLYRFHAEVTNGSQQATAVRPFLVRRPVPELPPAD
ncbi:Uncharacterised protein [Mycobacteroides abscessus subsp. bolletii]|uniref:DUF6941 family protein n=1 Tax=Mycobacteroides abscessus TaxID=36809 RepID=UPI00092A7016|nr:Uncharacterised protein [Mycobacteroides abscessus subsp. bolletii]SHY73199.1 Uncharacterised protein [Mycobacteroides abscessus subsp. bolletii]